MKSLFLLTIFVFANCAFAQGFGTGADGALVVAAGGTSTINTVATNLTASVASGGNSITVSSAAGFAVNDQLVIIQMTNGSGGTAGLAEEHGIVSIAGNTFTIYPNLSGNFTVGASSVVQVLRIAQYSDVTINATGTLTAPTWNGSTGGVLYMYVSGTLDLRTGGNITMSGTGFAGGVATAAVAGGAGGAGGTAGAGIGGNGGNGGSAGTCGTGGLGGSGLAGKGGDGALTGTAGNAGNAGAFGAAPGGNAPRPAVNLSSYRTAICLGDGGRAGSGGASGTGGGGGGGGGQGSVAGAAGAGTAGGAGGIGGTGGAGGRGGGVIVVFVNNFIYSGSITANGASGSAGGNGGNGGTGGNGGAGASVGGLANGGGGGGAGGGGAAGAGGNGGDGGASGIVWIDYASQGGAGGTTAADPGAAGALGFAGIPGCPGTPGLGGAGLLPGIAGLTCASCGAVGLNGSAGLPASAYAQSVVLNSNALPVELLNFSAVCSSPVVKLKWETATETNCDRFEVQYSADGINYQPRFTLPSHLGNSLVRQSYSVTDTEPLANQYYRLKQYDLNGKSTLYNAIVASCESSAGNDPIQVMPNPAGGGDDVQVYLGSAEVNAVFRVHNSLGQMLYESTIISEEERTRVIHAGDLAPGIYILSVSNGAKPSVKKLVVH